MFYRTLNAFFLRGLAIVLKFAYDINSFRMTSKFFLNAKIIVHFLLRLMMNFPHCCWMNWENTEHKLNEDLFPGQRQIVRFIDVLPLLTMYLEFNRSCTILVYVISLDTASAFPPNYFSSS